MRTKPLITIILACMQAVWIYANDSLRVSFVNFYPGSDIYELEGHSVLRVQDGHQDLAISYGMFDFNSPNFVYRFVSGQTDYWVSAIPWDYFIYGYLQQGRTIIEHPVPLDSLQQSRLRALLADNLLPSNRVYRYNYVKDNCALRPLRLLQAAIGDSIVLPEPQGALAQANTYRDVMRYYHRNYPWYQFGIDLALGSGIDKPITAWDKAFAPVVLDNQLEHATVLGASAPSRKLTSGKIIIYKGSDATLPPTPWLLSPMAFALLVLILAIVLTLRDIRRQRVTRWFDAILYGVYGIAGLLLTFLIFVSVHEATSPNWLYLWLNPLCLIVPVFIWQKNHNLVFSYQIINFALILIMAVAWPWTGQSGNPAFVPLILSDAVRALSYVYVTIARRKHHT